MQELEHPEICSSCRKKMTMIKKAESMNMAYICENPRCSLKIDFGKVENWEKINNQ